MNLSSFCVVSNVQRLNLFDIFAGRKRIQILTDLYTALTKLIRRTYI